jgi:phosphoribosylaminoimidazolecarboxamide formyltransferase/IMP cyclohydrolase
MDSASAAPELAPPPHITIRRALLSVSDKVGLDQLANGLVAAGVDLFASGGTRKYLQQLGLPVHEVGDYTGFPEMLDGRLKTLHPKIHGGILCRHDRPDDMQAIAQHGIVPFELVVVNLYPFEATIRRPDVTDALAIENIDIGGPTLVRGAAKNHRYVTIATSPEQYRSILEQVQSAGGTTYELRRQLAGAAYALTARYDAAIGAYFARSTTAAPGASAFATDVEIRLRLQDTLRYGENPHQRGALYVDRGASAEALVHARQLHGKELSYNNLLDLDSAWAMVRMLGEPAAVVIKHNNPCGAATDAQLSVAMRRALDGDPVSAFGSVIAVNRAVDPPTAEVLAEPDRFVEAIVAPGFDLEAFRILTTKPKWKANVRLMQIQNAQAAPRTTSALQYRPIDGGFLVQEADSDLDAESEWKAVTNRQPTAEQLAELRFGWAMVRHVKSNAITLSKDRALVGVGAGQMSRVDSVEIAIRKAGDRVRGSVLASDAFFPFPDSIALAAKAGIVAVIQPGGSKRDDEVIAACNQHGLPMVFTGRRHFKH